MNVQPFCQTINDSCQSELTTFIAQLKAADGNIQTTTEVLLDYLITLNNDMFIQQLYGRDPGAVYVLFNTGTMMHYNFKIYGSLLPSVDKEEGYIYFLGLTEADVKTQMFKALMQGKVEAITIPIRLSPCLQ